jgi:glycosyltransferase involved in cell wall biosynthesis
VGELYDPTSPESLAAAVRRIVDDHDTYAARRREARRLALEKFNWETEEPALLGVYRSLGTS